MTGTPLDLTPFGDLLQGIGILYLLAALVAFVLALKLPTGWKRKTASSLLVVAAFGAVPISGLVKHLQMKDALNTSLALFHERCKSAGEKITRKIPNVEGVVWMKWRAPISNVENFADQFKLDDPFGHDCGAEDCIARLLRVTRGAALNQEEANKHQVGYEFVETVDPKDGHLYRYRAVIRATQRRTPEQLAEYIKNTSRDPGLDIFGVALERQLISEKTASYGITWDDISARDDREHWIAGSSLRVIDLRSNEIIGERRGYMIDRGQGSQVGFRSPWLFAEQTACPEFPVLASTDQRRRRSGAETRDFVQKILQPTGGN